MSIDLAHFIAGMCLGVGLFYLYDRRRRRGYHALIAECHALLAVLQETLDRIKESKS